MPKKRDDYNGYMRRYMLDRYHRRRREAIKQLGGECSKCGGRKRLEIDHRNRTKKKFPMAKALASWSEKRVQKELKKCQLLCRGCHQKKTLMDLGQQDAKTAHGTLSSYRYCRCDLCKAARAKYSREYKRRKHAEAKTGS